MLNSTDYNLSDSVFHISSLSQTLTLVISVLTIVFNHVVIICLHSQRGSVSAVLYNQLMGLGTSDVIAGVISAFPSLTLIPVVNMSTVACICILYSYNVAQCAVLFNLSFISYRIWKCVRNSSTGRTFKLQTFQRSTLNAWGLSFICNLPSLASFSLTSSIQGCPHPGLFVNKLSLYTFPLNFLILIATDILYVHTVVMTYAFDRHIENELTQWITNQQFDDLRRETFHVLNRNGVTKVQSPLFISMQLSQVIEYIGYAKVTNEHENALIEKDQDNILLDIQDGIEDNDGRHGCVDVELHNINENCCKTHIQCGKILASYDYIETNKKTTPESVKPQKEADSTPFELGSEVGLHVDTTVKPSPDYGHVVDISAEGKLTFAADENTLLELRYGMTDEHSELKNEMKDTHSERGQEIEDVQLEMRHGMKEYSVENVINTETMHNIFIKFEDVDKAPTMRDLSESRSKSERKMLTSRCSRQRMTSSYRTFAFLTLLLTILTANIVTLLHSVIFFTSNKCYDGVEFVCTYHIISLNSLLNPFLYSATVKPIRAGLKKTFHRILQRLRRSFKVV